MFQSVLNQIQNNHKVGLLVQYNLNDQMTILLILDLNIQYSDLFLELQLELLL